MVNLFAYKSLHLGKSNLVIYQVRSDNQLRIDRSYMLVVPLPPCNHSRLAIIRL